MKKITLVLILLIASINTFAGSRTVNLSVAYKPVNFTGAARKAMTINQQLPAPTLHFRQGDRVTINVTNNMDKETAIHWHGVLVPWQMDGVKGINQHGIKPGETFKYQFRLEQSGTYWYHAHEGLQEQSGIYGAFIIDPPQKPAYSYNKDYVIVLSDWTNTDPDQVLANLKKEGDYYSPRFPLQPSLAKFIHEYSKASTSQRAEVWSDYMEMQRTRMSLYDFSDIAYDAYLLNGRASWNPWRGMVKIGDVVRLRFIGAGASTIFKVKIPESTMQVMHIQGNDVKPYPVHEFMIAPGETLDVLVKIIHSKPTYIYAESLDTLGAAYGALVTDSYQALDMQSIKRFPEPQPVMRAMMDVMMGATYHGTTEMKMPLSSHAKHDMGDMKHDMGGMKHDMGDMKHDMDDMKHDMGDMKHDMGDMKHDMGGMKHDMGGMKHDMPIEPTRYGDAISKPQSTYTTSIDTSYKHAKAAVKTNDPGVPVAGTINMELFGYMDKYIWFINGVPEYDAKPIVLQPGKRYRFVFTNTSMMYHPMHIHGHWFILRKGEGEYDPLLHTINVPPGATITADVDTDASGQWIFHCHLLYHMSSGMSRVFQYSTLLELMRDEIKPEDVIEQTAYKNRPIVRVDEVRPLEKMLVHHPMAHPHKLWSASFVDAGVDPFENKQTITFKGMYGSDWNKLELFMNDAEIENGSISQADLDIFYWRNLYQFWAVKGGLNYYYRPSAAPYWQPGIGVEGLLPYFIDLDLRGYLYAGSARFDLEVGRDTQLTNNLFLLLDIRGILASKTVNAARIGSGLNRMIYTIHPYYRLMPGLSMFAEFEHETDYGSYKNLVTSTGDNTGGNAFTVGLSIVF